MYKEQLRSLIIMGIIGFVVGIAFVLFDTPGTGFGNACIVGFLVAGLPYGWQFSGKIVGGWFIVGNIGVMLIALMLRVVLAILTGWIAYPIALVYTFIRSRHEV